MDSHPASHPNLIGTYTYRRIGFFLKMVFLLCVSGFVIFETISGALSPSGTSVNKVVQHGLTPLVIAFAGIWLVLFLACAYWLLSFCFERIVVTDTHLIHTNSFGRVDKTIPLSDITASDWQWTSTSKAFFGKGIILGARQCVKYSNYLRDYERLRDGLAKLVQERLGAV